MIHEQPERKIRTYREAFLGKFPEAPVACVYPGMPVACRKAIYGGNMVCGGKRFAAPRTCAECWDEEIAAEAVETDGG